MSWAHDEAHPKCDQCGRFIALADIIDGRATHWMITPESDVSSETWETLCRAHAQNVCVADRVAGSVATKTQ